MNFPLSLLRLLTAASVSLWLSLSAHAQQTPQDKIMENVAALSWQTSPGIGLIDNKAEIKIPSGTRFLSASDTKQFLQLMGNLPADNEFTLATSNLSWFAIFAFDPTGYVKDDEQIDADQLLSTLKEQSRTEADERKKLGLPVLNLIGWFFSWPSG
jgi:uncharacterized membrane-anchored protein